MTHPPAFELDRYLAGDQDEAACRELENHLSQCPNCRAYVASLEAEQANLLQQKPAEAFVKELGQRAEQCKRPQPQMGWRIWAMAGASAVVAAFILFLILPKDSEPGRMRWMGKGTVVKVHVERNGVVSLLADKKVKAGDRLRYEVFLPNQEQGYAAVFAVVKDWAFPVLANERKAQPFSFASSLLLPGSVVLDPGGGKVHLVLVVRPQPFDLGELAAELERMDRERKPLGQLSGVAHELNVDLEEP